ncbi:folylpolyglutamate synthase/dihydrofolate synthase family protein [Haloactinospora alba]|uniref:hypothetical protein n=1 Tax=Haloactinospora alba TaxID=405555 RepID=UPI00114D5B15|nr:hypothetical protein [Haloactinospora alba]
MPSLDVFFQEWHAYKTSGQRSLSRAQALMDELELTPQRPPVLGVVGSKGKGTTATYASAHLAAAGLRVVTVTGPSFRSYRERIRLDGTAVDERELSGVAAELARAQQRLPESDGSYLAPNGLFLLGGLLHARNSGADVCVLEAGMGGHGDELRLIGPSLVAASAVFAEHVGKLGDTVAEIAAEKAAVAGPATRAVVRLPQTADAAESFDRTVDEVSGGRVRPEVVPGAEDADVPPRRFLPPGLSADSARLGWHGAGRMLELLDRPAVSPSRRDEVASTVRLPARLSRHRWQATEVMVDSAINRTGVRTALEHARALWPRIDRVVVCLPDHKDLDGAVRELGELPATAAVLPESHLRFERPLPQHWDRVPAEALTADALAAMGEYVLVLGTVYFTGRVLDAIGADTDRLFSA